MSAGLVGDIGIGLFVVVFVLDKVMVYTKQIKGGDSPKVVACPVIPPSLIRKVDDVHAWSGQDGIIRLEMTTLKDGIKDNTVAINGLADAIKAQTAVLGRLLDKTGDVHSKVEALNERAGKILGKTEQVINEIRRA